MSDIMAQATTARMRSKPRGTVTIVLTSRTAPISKELAGITAFRISRSADTLTDGWTATVPWVRGKDRDLDQLFLPYAYPRAQVFIGPRLVNTGYLYTIEPELTEEGLLASLEGYASTADLVDSTVQPENDNACMWADTNIVDWCNQIAAKFGIECNTNLSGAYLEPFPLIQCSVTDKYGDVITRLAFQRNMLATNDINGNLLLWAGASGGATVGTLREGEPPVTQWKIKFDGRKRFGTYIVYGQDGQGSEIQSVAYDAVVPSYRCQGVTAGQVGLGNVQTTAVWKRNVQLVQALTIPLPVAGWYQPDGADVWTPNTLVTIVSKSLGIANGFTFMIRATEHVLQADQQTCVLSLIPPNIYSSSPLQEPWRAA